MTQKLNEEQLFPISQKKLFGLLIDPVYHEDKARYLGVLEVNCTRKKDSDGTITLTIVEKRKPMFGKEPDKSTFIISWNPYTFESKWKQIQHGFEDRSRAEGTSRLEAVGEEQCRLYIWGEIEVKVPFLGGMIEKKIVKFVKEENRKETAFMRMRLGID